LAIFATYCQTQSVEENKYIPGELLAKVNFPKDLREIDEAELTQFCDELRQYIIAKLLFNPDEDVDAIINDFVGGYYGPAAKHIQNYITTMHDALDSSGGNLGIYGYPYDGIKTYLTPELIIKYEKIFDLAEAAAEDYPDYLERVQTARLPLEFAILDISLRNVNDDLSWFTMTDGNWKPKEDMLKRLDIFTARAKMAGVNRYWEHGNYPDDYHQTVKRFVLSSMQNHEAFNKPVELLTNSSEKYPVGGGKALTDGLKGINDYHFNWLGFEGPDLEVIIDLAEEKTVEKIEVDFLQEIKSWVFLPLYLEAFGSIDGENWYPLGKKLKQSDEQRESTFIETFEIIPEASVARYLKVHAKNRGLCPDWHPGATYPAWIFVDEVVVW